MSSPRHPPHFLSLSPRVFQSRLDMRGWRTNSEFHRRPAFWPSRISKEIVETFSALVKLFLFKQTLREFHDWAQALLSDLLQQRGRFPEVRGAESFDEPIVDELEQVDGVLRAVAFAVCGNKSSYSGVVPAINERTS